MNKLARGDDSSGREASAWVGSLSCHFLAALLSFGEMQSSPLQRCRSGWLPRMSRGG